MGLQACLGLLIDAPEEKVTFVYPILPESLHEVQIRNLKVGKASLDIVVKRHELDVGITVTRREGHVEVVVVK